MIHIRALFVVVAVAAMALVSGCVPEPAPVPDASPAEKPVPSASPVSTDPAPTPLLNLTCAELLPGGVGGGLLTERLPPLEYSTAHLFETFPRPDAFATEGARGTYCSTSNSKPQLVDDTLNPTWVAIEARILPDASAQFAPFEEFESRGGTVSAPFISCSGGTSASCALDFLVGEHWVNFTFWGVDPAITESALGRPPQLLEIADVASTIVRDAPLNDESWSVPAETVPLDADCEQFFGPERVASDLGVTEPIYFGPYEDYETAERAGRELAPAFSCPWHDGANRGVGGHSILPGGAWALQLLVNTGEYDGWDDLDVTGLGKEDSVIYSCTEVEGRCVANMVIGHNWVQLQVLADENGLDAASTRELLRDFTQTAVTAIRA